jgi:hypothetical protein
MQYESGQIVSLGDRVKYNGQAGCIAVIGSEPGVGCSGIQRSDWGNMGDLQVLILFDNGALLMLDNTVEEDLLVFCERKQK